MVSRKLLGSVVALALLAAGCSGGGGGNGNSKPEPLILEPHELSSHLPGEVDFDGRATDEEDGTLLPAALSWQVLDADGDVVGGFQGDSSTLSLLVPGDYTAKLTAEDSKGRKRSVEHPFRIANTIGEIREPNNESVLGIADPFDITGRAETVALGAELSQIIFVGIDLANDNEVFRLPVAVPAGLQTYETTVTPSLNAGRFRLHLEVTTNLPAELAEDNIRVLADAAPDVSITSPANGTHVAPGASLQFSAVVSDLGGGIPTVEWESSVAGTLSGETDFTTSSLTRAMHRVTITATDENGLTGRASVDVYVEEPGTPLFLAATGLPDDDVRALTVKSGVMPPDSIWVGTANGLARVANDTGATAATHAMGYNSDGVGPATSALCITSGECLISIAGKGVSVRDAGDTAWSTFQTGLTDISVNGIAESPVDGRLFFATAQGITETDAARANPVAHDQNALGVEISSVAVDSTGVVWAGTVQDGLVRLSLPSSAQTFDEDDGLSDNVVRAVAVDGDDNIWVGTEQGLSRLVPGTGVFTRWDGDELPDERVLSLAVNGDIIWIGTMDGAARYDTTLDLWTYFDETDLGSTRVNAVAVDPDGAVWFGMGPAQSFQGGLTRYDGP